MENFAYDRVSYGENNVMYSSRINNVNKGLHLDVGEKKTTGALALANSVSCYGQV